MTNPIRAFQWDLARQTERLDWLIAQLPRYAEWGYREVYLHLENAVEYPSFPAIARRDAYSVRQMARLVAAAERSGIGVVPIVNLLGHTQYLIDVPELRDLNECRATDGSPLAAGQICPLHPRTLEVAGRLIGDVARYCTAGKVHVGLDESTALGRHPLSRHEIAEVGLAAHFGKYLRALHGLASERGLRMGYWADFLALLPETIEGLPAGTAAYDWYYYPFRGRPALELRNFEPYELAPRLKAGGVEYWGCPMSGPFRHEPMPTFGDRLANQRDWWRRCRRVGADGYLVTSWETSRTGAE
ncbi:MAG: family 20 glycosylhydrolase, partial [Opitutaceae bacterium]